MRNVSNVSYDFDGKVVLITGAARGMGRVHALNFAEAGADLVVSDICRSIDSVAYGLATEEQLAAVASEARDLGSNCVSTVCDVRDAQNVQAMVDLAISEFGKVDVLINNAGIESLFEVPEMPEDAWDDVVDTMLKGTFLCSQAVSASMIENRGGKIVNIGSTASTTGMPGQSHYCAAKHGIIGFTRSLATELAEYGVNVNVVCPGGTDTPLVEGLVAHQDADWMARLPQIAGHFNLFDPAKMLDSQETSNAVMWLASDASRYVTGAALAVDAGYTIK